MKIAIKMQVVIDAPDHDDLSLEDIWQLIHGGPLEGELVLPLVYGSDSCPSLTLRAINKTED